MKATSALIALLFVAAVSAHSWVACTNYAKKLDGFNSYDAGDTDAITYNDALCTGYPRNWDNYNGGSFGIDRGYNFQSTEACGSQHDGGFSAYSAQYPMATYVAGEEICMVWPAKNHAATDVPSCAERGGLSTNPFIPDGGIRLYYSGPNNPDPTQAEFLENSISPFGRGEHIDGTVDMNGFQNCPGFCEGNDKAMCGGCFTVPNLSPGVYTFQWSWIFNPGTPYKTCFDAEIVSGNSGSVTTGVQTTGVQTTGVQTTGAQTTGAQTGTQTTGAQTTGVQTTGVQTTGVQTTGVQTTGQTTGGSNIDGCQCWSSEVIYGPLQQCEDFGAQAAQELGVAESQVNAQVVDPNVHGPNSWQQNANVPTCQRAADGSWQSGIYPWGQVTYATCVCPASALDGLEPDVIPGLGDPAIPFAPIPESEDAVSVELFPAVLPTSDVLESFVCSINYNAGDDRTIVIDMLDSSNNGVAQGTLAVEAGSGTEKITVSYLSDAPVGTYTLRAWIVDKTIFETDSAPHAYELFSLTWEVALTAEATEAIYPGPNPDGFSEADSSSASGLDAVATVAVASLALLL